MKKLDSLFRVVFTGCAFFCATDQGNAAVATDAAITETTKNKEDSAKAAQEWLAIVDKGNFADSWENGSVVMKLRIPKNTWVTLLEAMHKGKGNTIERKILEQRPAVDPKGLPQGEYMVIVYNTKFSNKADAKELVTLVLESSGQWKVLTYAAD